MVDFDTARRVMVDNQLRTSNVTDRRLLAAMGATPREMFVPEDRRTLAYADVAHVLSPRRSLPAPAEFAKLVQLAAIEPEDSILDVGAGTGYSAAVLAQLGAEVVALESDTALAEAARQNLAAVGASQVEVLAQADASRLFDVVVIEGAVLQAPDDFFPVLKDGGRLVVVIGTTGAATAHVFVRSGDDVAGRAEFNARLPLLEAAPRPEEFVF